MLKLVERAVGILRKQNLEDFDVYGMESFGFTVEVKEGGVDRIKTSRKEGIAVRVVLDGKLGFAYTTDVSDDGIRIAIECAKENAKVSTPDDYVFSMKSSQEFPFSLADESYGEIPVEKKVSLALELEAKVREFDRRIKKIRKASYSDSLTTVYYSNSNDHTFSYTTTAFSLSTLVAAEENGSSQTGWDYDVKRKFSELNPDLVAVRAGESAVELLGATPLETKRLPVIFKNVVFAELISSLSPVFLGDNILRGKSLFMDKLTHEVASSTFSLYDDPFQYDGMGSAPFDDEGVPTRKKAVIDRGILKNFLLDIYSARKLSELYAVEPTGNGMRASLSSPPHSGITNLVVEKGVLELEELVKMPEEVILITDAMGMHTINPISGEFSIGVSGIYYRDGKPIQPVVGMTVAGNVRDLLMGVAEIGNDQRWIGNICSPSVLIKSLTVAGE